MDAEIIENHKRYSERILLYKQFGYDIEENRKFIFEIAQPIYGEILEVGTGKGYMTLLLAKEGYRFVSIDISKEEQELAKLNLRYFGVDDKVNFRIENAENLSFPDKSFDFIISVNTVHHIENPLKVMDEIIRVLSFEGTIVLSDFTEKGFDIVDKIHLSEGRTHTRFISKVRFLDIENYFRDKHFVVRYESNGFQQVLVIYRPLM